MTTRTILLRTILLRGLFLPLILVAAVVSLAAQDMPRADHPRVTAGLARLPPYFIQNRGVYPDEVAYSIQGADKTLFFTKDGSSTPWTIGEPHTISGTNAPPNRFGALYLSFIPPRPIELFPGFETYFDPGFVIVVVPVQTDSKENRAYIGYVPNRPSLSCQNLALQAAFYPLLKWPGFETTHGLNVCMSGRMIH